MQRSSPLARLSLRVHQSRQRHGLAGVAQRFALAILPDPPAAIPPDPVLPAPVAAVPERAMPEPVTPEQTAARERARRALIEARRTMSGVIGEEMVLADLSSETVLTSITPDWDQLRAYLEESEQERAALKEELTDLRETVRALQTRLDDFQRVLPPATVNGQESSATEPAPAIDEEGAHPAEESTSDRSDETEAAQVMAGDTASAAQSTGADMPEATESRAASAATEEPAEDSDQVRELRERVLRALRERVFAAGTVGTRVQVSPVPKAPALREMIERFSDDPLVEHAEPVEAKEENADSAQIRVTLRAPMRWEQFGALLERALDQPIAQEDVRWSQGAVQVRLPSEPKSETPESGHDATEPCA